MPAGSLLSDEFLTRLEALTLTSQRIFRGHLKGERRSKRRGFSSEFADYRNYVEGDDLRHIDWNIYGRLDRLFLKLFMEEEDLHVHVLLDTSRSMDWGDPNKLDYARRVAAAIGYIGLVNQDRVQIHAFSDGVRANTGALRGRKSSRRLFDFLDSMTAEGGTALLNTCNLLVQSRSFGKGICILISDLLDPAGYEEALKRLIGHNMDVYVIHLLAPEEVDPPLKGDLRLVDVEDRHEQEITVSLPLLKTYNETVRGYCAGIKSYCTKRGARYMFSATDVPFEDLVLTYLRRSGLFH